MNATDTGFQQELFNYISENFNHTPTQGEMNDLRQIIHKEPAPAPDLLPFLVAKWEAQLEGYYSVHATTEQRTVRKAVLEEYGWLISMHVRDRARLEAIRVEIRGDKHIAHENVPNQKNKAV